MTSHPDTLIEFHTKRGTVRKGWQEEAICTGLPELFIPTIADDEIDADRNTGRPGSGSPRIRADEEWKVLAARAIAICQECPVRRDCLEYALKGMPGDIVGVWGGVDFGRSQSKRSGRGFMKKIAAAKRAVRDS